MFASNLHLQVDLLDLGVLLVLHHPDSAKLGENENINIDRLMLERDKKTLINNKILIPK